MGTYLSLLLDCFKRLHEGIQFYTITWDNYVQSFFYYLAPQVFLLDVYCLMAYDIMDPFLVGNACNKARQQREVRDIHMYFLIYLTIQKTPDVQYMMCVEMRKKRWTTTTSNYTVNVVKGPSWLTFSPTFDIINSICMGFC